jgi:hypothetical protein
MPFSMFNMEKKIDDICGTFFNYRWSARGCGPAALPGDTTGSVFIANEFNLTEDTAIQGLAVSLEPSTRNSFLISGIVDWIKLDNRFMFIACKNAVRIVGAMQLDQYA